MNTYLEIAGYLHCQPMFATQFPCLRDTPAKVRTRTIESMTKHDMSKLLASNLVHAPSLFTSNAGNAASVNNMQSLLNDRVWKQRSQGRQRSLIRHQLCLTTSTVS